MSDYLLGCDVLGEVIGAFDIAARQHDMDGLKQVPVAVATSLLKGGQQAIDQARATATSKNLPGATARDGVFWNLQRHQLGVNALIGTPNAMYADAADLKKWVMQAFIEANAVDEGAEFVDGAWSRMWSEIGRNIAALPAAVSAKIAEAESTGKWVLVGGVAIAVVTLGLGTYLAVRRELR